MAANKHKSGRVRRAGSCSWADSGSQAHKHREEPGFREREGAEPSSEPPLARQEGLVELGFSPGSAPRRTLAKSGESARKEKSLKSGEHWKMEEQREPVKTVCSVMRSTPALGLQHRTGSPAAQCPGSGIAHSQFSRRPMTVYGKDRVTSDDMWAQGEQHQGGRRVFRGCCMPAGLREGTWLEFRRNERCFCCRKGANV